MRIAPESPLAPVARGGSITLWVDGQPVVAYAGETLAAALLAAGRRALYRPAGYGEPIRPHGVYCGMGVCFECLVWVEQPRRAETDAPAQDGAGAWLRACVTPAEDGMRVRTRADLPGA